MFLALGLVPVIVKYMEKNIFCQSLGLLLYGGSTIPKNTLSIIRLNIMTDKTFIFHRGTKRLACVHKR